MKVQVRDGFVVRYNVKVDLGDGKTESQEMTLYAAQKADLPADIVDQHAHKLEPADKAAADYLAAKVAPQQPGAELGLTPEALALVKTLALELVKQIAPAAAPAAA